MLLIFASCSYGKKEACAVLCISGQRGGNEPARAAEPDAGLGWGGLR